MHRDDASGASPKAAWGVRRVGVIIHPHMDARMGANVQGPSLIRMPGWAEGRLGRYHLYFADHRGTYIRLAYAEAVEGPWRIHEAGSLQLADSLFPTEPPPPAARATGERLDGQAPPGTPGIPSAEEDAIVPHIASPDVHLDEERREIAMYFHGLVAHDTQRTRLAVSRDGVRFTALPEMLGPSYFRVFRHEGAAYALAMPGILFRSEDGRSDFVRGPKLFPGTRQRHTAVLVQDGVLHVFWTRVGDAPEHILHSRVPLRGDWRDWRVDGEAEELLRPEHDWEGADLPASPSWRSAVNLPVNQLRDPAVFEDADGRIWLLYAVRGEAGIALAELLPARN